MSPVKHGDQLDRFDVVVLGSANTDLILRVDALPGPGRTVLGAEPVSGPGGKGANQAVAAADAGASVAFIGCVGSDREGAAIAADLLRGGVSTTHLRSIADHRTGLAVVLVDSNGENQIVVSPGANSQLSVDDVEDSRALIGSARVLLLQLEVPFDVVRHALIVASKSDTAAVLNLSPTMRVDADTMAMVDVLIVNRSEAEFILGSTVVDGLVLADIAERLRQLGPAAVVVTAGEAGALCVTAEGLTHVPAQPVRVVDTTGAGDAFAGALAAELSRGAGLAAAVGVANAAGAAAVQRSGARGHYGSPSMDGSR
ncbi:MAG: PfkB [Pseudonocardiales bacterium]|nr:PfkB [Pseudonocardiales bacterium]